MWKRVTPLTVKRASTNFPPDPSSEHTTGSIAEIIPRKNSNTASAVRGVAENAIIWTALRGAPFILTGLFIAEVTSVEN